MITQLQRKLAWSFARGIILADTLESKRTLALLVRGLDPQSRNLVSVCAFALATAQTTTSNARN